MGEEGYQVVHGEDAGEFGASGGLCRRTNRAIGVTERAARDGKISGPSYGSFRTT